MPGSNPQESLLIYTPRATPRLEYIFRFIFSRILGLDYQVTHIKSDFLRSAKPVLNYSHVPLGKGIWIQSHTLLFEEGIKSQDPKPGKWKEMPVLFQTGPGPDLPFDLFAASFFLLSRYEEYFPHTPDVWFRFPAKESIAHREGFLDEPVIDYWAGRLMNVLKIRYPSLRFAPRTYRFIPTIDVDQAWAYKHKGVLRNIGGGLKFLFRGDLNELKLRFGTLSGLNPDPFNSFDYLIRIFKTHQLEPVFFFQVGRYGKFDKNIPGRHPAMRNLIKQVHFFAPVGLHPSFRSNDHSGILASEIMQLKDVLKEEPAGSRQHYIRLNIPKTYRRLLDAGIYNDFSMGYPDHPGFRAGTASSFRFFDLGTEQESELEIHPFQVMDSTLNHIMHLTPEEALETISGIVSKIKKVSGTFIPVWHNSSLHDRWEWKGWRQVFEKMVIMSVPSK